MTDEMLALARETPEESRCGPERRIPQGRNREYPSHARTARDVVFSELRFGAIPVGRTKAACLRESCVPCFEARRAGLAGFRCGAVRPRFLPALRNKSRIVGGLCRRGYAGVEVPSPNWPRRALQFGTSLSPRVFRAEDVREFLSAAGAEAVSVADQADGKIMSAFVRATKPAASA